jgi:adenine-specific DNA-methyltransferase
MNRPILQAPSPAAAKLEQLRQLFPQAVETDHDGRIRINAAALQRALDPANPSAIGVEEDGYELRWVGKHEAYHSAFMPVQKIVQPCPQDSVNWEQTGNLLLKGDNLDALRLLRHSYFGKIKLIYIDPPYNTQSDSFIYRDNFSVKQSEVLEQLGYSADNIDYIKNIYGARTHSGWLSFMYPRLLLAKDLLRDDGVIFISIDDNEQAQLKLLCDEVFGQENFVANIIWHNSSRQSDQVANEHEYLLVYTKNEPAKQNWTRSRSIASQLQSEIFSMKKEGKRDVSFATNFLRKKIDKIIEKGSKSGENNSWLNNYKNIDENWKIYYAVDLSGEGDGPPRVFDGRVMSAPSGRHWMGQDYINELQLANRIVWRGDRAYRKLFIEESYENLKSILKIPTRNGSEEIKTLLEKEVFSKPKPIDLIKRIIYFASSKKDITLDFFAGSGTTGEAVMRLNAEDGGQRKFILVQIPQPIDAKKQKEAHQFVTQTLAKPEATIFEITAERLRRAGNKILAEQAAQRQTQGDLLPPDPSAPALDTGFRVFSLENDPEALILQKPLQQASQADVLALQTAIATPQPQLLPRILYNLLLAEKLPLTTPIRTIIDQHLYLADNVVLVLQALALNTLTDTLRALQAEATAPAYLTVYAPWIADDNFMLGIKTVAETLGFSADKLRLRG